MMNKTLKKGITGIFAIAVFGGGSVVVADKQADPYIDRGSHYELPIVTDIPQGERVEIAKDRAEMTIHGWNDEYTIKIIPQIPSSSRLGANRRDFITPGSRRLLSKRMEYKSGDITAFIEPKAGTENEFDIDFTLESKPTTNVFEYVIEGVEDFDFLYQPELTPEEIAEGADRPENVVGSYAVYHKTKANHRVGSTNYATGKAFHIYRPKAIDANNNEVWADLLYKDGILSVTVPQSFLDNAVYPVRVDPTFGYTTIGGSFVSASNQLNATQFNLSEQGDVSTISVYYNTAQLEAGETTTIGTAIYRANLSLVSDSTGVSGIINNDTEGWVTNNTASTPALNSGDYKLTAWFDGSATDSIQTYFDTGSTGQNIIDTSRDGPPVTWPDPIVADFTFDRQHSIYATYTISAPPAAETIYQSEFFFE